MTREEMQRRLESAEKQNLGLLDEIKWLKEKLESRLEEAEKQMIGLQDEIANLKAKLNEVQGEPEIPDIPKFESPVVWAIDSKLGVFYYGISPYNESSFNAFNTKEMAHEFAKKCKLIAMMLHCKWYVDRDYVPDWESDTNIGKFYVIFDHCVNRFRVRTCYAEENTGVYFSTEEAAQKCANWLNAHWKESTENLT